MTVFEEEILLERTNESASFLLSKDLNELMKAIYIKTGIAIHDIQEYEWTLNHGLGETAKNLMRKREVVYSSASWIENNCLNLVINHQAEERYYLYHGRTIHGVFITNINPVLQNLTAENLDSMVINEIIFAECAESGAMGNAGGVMIYVIKEQRFYCYETNIRKDRALYEKAIDIFAENSSSFRNMSITNPAAFILLGGGFGNRAFIKRSVVLMPEDRHFVYINNGKAYIIYCSVRGVFNRVEAALRRIGNIREIQ